MISAVRSAVRPLARGLQMLVAIGVVRLLGEGKGLQRLQVELLDGELIDQVERFHDYGLASRPKAGAEGVFLSLMGVRGRGVMIAVGDRRYRLQTLAEGEVALHDDQGQSVWLKRDGIKLTSTSKVEIDAPQIVLGAGANRAVARVGDPVVGGVITAGSAVASCV